MNHAANILSAATTRRLNDARADVWLLRAMFVTALLLIVTALVLHGAYDRTEPASGRPSAASVARTVGAFDINSELAMLLVADTAALAEADAFPDVFPSGGSAAARAPLDLLAQIEPVAVPPPVAVAAASAPAPMALELTDEERVVVAANAERREIKVALLRLRARTGGGDAGIAAALAVEPLLRRAEHAAADLDGFGDALLLSEGEAMKRMAFFGFYASYASALHDIERIEAMLG